jgi:putative membrane protein
MRPTSLRRSLLLVLFTLSAAAGAQPFRTLNQIDAVFANEVANGNLAEIAMGRVAIERSTRKDVQAFGEQLISDHQLLNDELKTLVIGTSFTFPRELTANHRAHVAALRALSTKEFDAAFIAHMIKGHEAMIELFKAQVRDAGRESLRDYASAGLPTLETHLRHAKALVKPATSSR